MTVVIGGGASGLMAAYAAAVNGNRVLILEKNEKLGKKLYITGKGRCNLTNDCLPEEFLQNVVHGAKFLTGTAYRFSPSETMRFMEEHGLTIKVERGNRVFPASDHASDVTATLERACRGAGAEILLNTPAIRILAENGRVVGVETEKGKYACDAAIVATGGLSYPSTGSTGDGYAFAKSAGHSLTPCVPSLVGIEVEEVSAAQGVSLRNVRLTAQYGSKRISSRQGELLFTHYGISGPLALSLSAEINRLPLKEVKAELDFKPALDGQTLDGRLLRDFAARSNEQMKSVARGLLPASLVQLVLKRAGISPQTRANAVTKEERARLLTTLKHFRLNLVKLRGFDEAVITSGGVTLSEIDPKTMESRKIKGLYFCGEVLDLDAYTGGFNLQIAFSTGFMAGNSIKSSLA